MENVKNYGLPLLVFTSLALLFTYPIFQNITYWGGGDWDQHFFYSEAARKTILEYHQFPFWNPWYCGGNALLAHPESLFLGPFFILNLIFGTVIGFKLQILVHLIIGMLGMYLICQWYKLRRFSSYLAPILFMLSSAFANRVVAGHTLYFSMAFLPFVFYFYLRSYSAMRYGAISAVFLVFIVFSGGTYPFLFSVLLIGIHGLLLMALRRSLNPLYSIGLIFLLAFGLGAIKLLPMLQFTSAYGFSFDDDQPTSLKTLLSGFLSFDQSPESRTYYSTFTQQVEFYEAGKKVSQKAAIDTQWQWHEYSAYFGLSFVLLVGWFFVLGRKHLLLLLLFVIFLILYFGDSLLLYRLLRGLPLAGSFHGPSRFVNILLFLGSIFAAMMLSWIEGIKKQVTILGKSYPLGTAAAFSFVVLMAVNLFFVVEPLYQRVFAVEPILLRGHEAFMQAYTADKYRFQFPNILQNVGTINCYDRIKPPRAAVPAITLEGESNPGYLGEAWLTKENRSRQVAFSPNKIVVETNASSDLLVVNQNFVKGWDAGRELRNYNGLLAVPVEGQETIVFRYLPPLFRTGMAVSLFSLLIAAILLRKLI
ncbi:MAG TPA: hypothetical protein VJB08_01860 [Candidatus Nanoarchaeia archaeon]|nr:hypothetical protein [Candidatus Nanoarchaeia archaeon]